MANHRIGLAFDFLLSRLLVLDEEESSWRSIFGAIFCPTIMLFGILAAVKKYGSTSDQIIKFVNAFFVWAIRTVGLGLIQLFIALFITALGFGAHYFKRRSQKWYGNVKILVGFLSALFVAGTLSPGNLDLSKWATLAGAA